jgi:prevent-host-death family protein
MTRLSQVMKQVNVHEAKTHLSRLLQEVEEGEEIVIARNGEPVAKLVRHQPALEPRKPGWAKGRIEILEGFDEYDEQIARDFGMLD